MSRKRNTKRVYSRPCRGKVRYRDQQEARHAWQTLQRNSRRAKIAGREYFCDGCHGWHITST